MLAITAVPVDARHPDQQNARALFREYGEFLLRTQACGGTFPFDRFAEEVRALPDCYRDRGGDVLLGWVEGLPAGIIAYRAASPEDHQTCEIKRLFVREGARGRGVARALLTEVMGQATAAGFARAILDSDVTTMPGAIALYRSLGFTEYRERKGNLAYFERGLP